MSYKSKYVDESLMEDVFNKLNRLGRYASRQELLDEIRDLNMELDREKKMMESYRTRYETKQTESSHLSKNLESVRDYQTSLMKEHRDLEDKYQQLKKQNEHQKQDMAALKRELDSKELNYFLNRRKFLDYYNYYDYKDYRWLRERDLEKSLSSTYKYWHWRPWLYRYHRDIYDKYYPYTTYDPSWYYSPYYYDKYNYLGVYPWRDPYRRKLDLEDRLDTIQRMTDDLKLNNHKMLTDLKTARSSFE